MSRSRCVSAAPGLTRVPGERWPLFGYRELLRMSLDECQGRVGHLAPARIDDQRMPSLGKLDDLGHALVALLLLVGSIGNRAGDGVVLGAFDDKERSPVGVLSVDFGFGPGVEVLRSGLENSLA